VRIGHGRRVGGWRLVVSCALSSVLAACGTTVALSGAGSGQLGGQGVANGPGPGPGSYGGSGGIAASRPGASSAGSGGVNGTAGGGTPAAVAGGTSAGTSGGGGQLPAPSTKVVSAGAPIVLGYSTAGDYSAFASSVGVGGSAAQNASVTNIKPMTEAMVSWINAHGGILGHPVQLAQYDFNIAEYAQDPASTEQAACTAWTQDDHAFAVVDTAGVAAGALPCLAARGTPLVEPDMLINQAEINRYRPYVWDPTAMTVDRYIPALVDRLVARRFFTGWNTTTGTPSAATPVRVGIMHFDDPVWNVYANLYKSELAHDGVKVTDEVTYPHGLQNESADTQNAVLRFRAHGVTEVLNANILFYEDAQSQGYYPRYALDSIIGPDVIAQNAPAQELRGSEGEGYAPYGDVDPASLPAELTPASHACHEIMKAYGQDSTDYAPYGVCDLFMFILKAAEASKQVSVRGLLAGGESLGTWVTAETWTGYFAPDRHAAARYFRDFAFDSSCTCYRYSGSLVDTG